MGPLTTGRWRNSGAADTGPSVPVVILMQQLMCWVWRGRAREERGRLRVGPEKEGWSGAGPDKVVLALGRVREEVCGWLDMSHRRGEWIN